MGMEPLKENDPKRLGEWRIVSRIGEGGFGTVFLAERGAQQSAIKILRDDFDSKREATSRFELEIAALEKLEDPFIARVLDYDLSAEKPWFATEYVNGPTLETKVKYDGVLKEEAWFRLASNLFHALTTSHAAGIIHKDVKPSNIIISDTHTKLIDFGISHISGLDLTKSKQENFGNFEGSILYSSPESFMGTSPPAMDVFSAASTLAFAGQGRSIWQGKIELQLMRSIFDDEPDLNDLTDLEQEFLAPLLNKNSSERPTSQQAYQSANRYIEFLIGKAERPNQFKSKIKLIELVQNKAAMFVIALTLIAVFAITASINNVNFFTPTVKSWFMADSKNLTADQQKKVSACKNLALSYNDYASAITTCKEPAETGDASAQYSLGYSLGELGREKEAQTWIIKAAQQRMPEALSWLAYNEIERGNYAQALPWAKQAADLGDLPGVNALGITYGYLGNYDLAVKWYEKSWELGDVMGAMNLGYHYRFDSINTSEADKWLKIAADTNSVYEGEAAFNYAEFLRIDKKNDLVSCRWYKKSAEAKYKVDKEDGVAAFKKYCKDVLFAEDSKLSTSPKKPVASQRDASKPVASPSSKTPVPATVISKDPVPTPIDSNKPITSSDSFKVSAPLASNVQVSNIFGRAFKGALFAWVIPLTNFKEDKVPALTGIQFRLIGYPDADWFEVPYKLKTELKSGTVHAEVDDLLFAVIFKDLKYCPEFRVVREEAGKISQIWSKGQPECANDYNP